MKIKFYLFSLLFTVLFASLFIGSWSNVAPTKASAQQRPTRAEEQQSPIISPLERNDPRAQAGAEVAAAEPMPYPFYSVAGNADQDPLGAAEAGYDVRKGQETLATEVPLNQPDDSLELTRSPRLWPSNLGPNAEIDTRDEHGSGRDPGRNPRLNTVIGPDNRTLITPTTVFPWRAMTKLIVTYPNNRQFICSGTMIAAKYTLTAGHCVYSHDNGGWARTIEVIPGLDGSYKPYGSAFSTYLRSYQGWTRDRDSNFDFALITLNRSIGNSTGWLGYASYATVNGLTGNIAGYPGDLSNGLRLYYHSGTINSSTANRVFYTIDTAGGQSGSSVYRLLNSQRYVFAVHTTGSSTTNGGTRITTQRYNDLSSWIASGQ